MNRALLVLILFVIEVGPACAQTETLVVGMVKLPNKSFIYPDTFAVYWRANEYEKQAGIRSVKIKYRTMFDDVIEQTDFMEDSIIGFIFGTDYVWARTHVIQCDIGVPPDWPNYKSKNTRLLTILPPDDEIETIRALVKNAFRWQNLKLLADAYERRKCFVNAYYVYAQLLYIDEEKARGYFFDFLSRNKLNFGSGVSMER